MTSNRWPSYLLERAVQPPPEGCAVVPGSTPVVSFGHPLEPRVATLGINPSSSEFLDRSKLQLAGAKRRLATLQSLGAPTYPELTAEHAAAIVDDCATYFERQPYRWFNVLDRILTEALRVSYYHKSACHLDLVQWATDPIWKKLSGEQQQRLVDGDLEFLRRQLSHEGYKVVLVNGATAMRWVEEAGIVAWEKRETLDTSPAARFSTGEGEDILFVGWSCNLQSQPGALRHVEPLITLVRKYSSGRLGGNGMTRKASLGRGTHFRNREALIAALERWYNDSDEDTIGDLTFGRAPWLSFNTSEGLADINADTRRTAVERMLRSSGLGHAWHVIENNRGKVNKIVFNDGDTHQGWYAYLREAVTSPREVS